jgi:hypothetical protein
VSDILEPSSPTTRDLKTRRGRRIIWSLLALAAVIAAGFGGVLVGRDTAPGPTIVVAPGPVVEQSPAATSVPVIRPQAPASGRPGLVASGDPSPSTPAVFSASSDLPDTVTVASGYSLRSGGVDGAALAGVLASTFGLAGDVEQTGTGWTVGQPGGSVVAVTVNDDPLVTWSYADPVAASAAASGVSMPAEDARNLASEVLSGIGVDVSSVDWQVDRYADLTEVTAWQLLKGARTQLAWRIGFGTSGSVVSASGFAAGLVEVPGYPVVGAATAVRRAGLPTWAELGPRLLPGPADQVAASTSGRPAVPSTTESGRPILQVPMSDVVLTQADLGLAQFWQPDGSLLILPAYELTGDDGSRWSLIAIAGDYVHFVDVPTAG